MPDFYYQIKAKREDRDGYTCWAWPPILSDMVNAPDKKSARDMIDTEYCKKFPMRVLQKDMATADFLLHIYEVDPADERTRGLFNVRNCKQCKAGFRVIDHYNDAKRRYAGRDYCSDECKDIANKVDNARLFSEANGGSKAPPVIYMIQNRNNGMCYIGKTTQPFTLRWWQHFFHGTDTKFHKAIAESKVTDWSFQVVEVIDIGFVCTANQSIGDYIRSREQHWIDTMDAINNGYNTSVSCKEEEQLPPMMQFFQSEGENENAKI